MERFLCERLISENYFASFWAISPNEVAITNKEKKKTLEFNLSNIIIEDVVLNYEKEFLLIKTNYEDILMSEFEHYRRIQCNFDVKEMIGKKIVSISNTEYEESFDIALDDGKKYTFFCDVDYGANDIRTESLIVLYFNNFSNVELYKFDKIVPENVEVIKINEEWEIHTARNPRLVIQKDGIFYYCEEEPNKAEFATHYFDLQIN